MTHPNHQTNGASLEDCHTNFFALTDLCGIKWRKLVWGESSFSPEPLDDPVLASYARCLSVDILCVWRRVATQVPGSSALNGGGGGGLFDSIGLPPAATASCSSGQQQPALSLQAAKELWIFWYGEEPDLTSLVSPELVACEGEQGSWENGLSYECRSLLFKSLHNLIERCLLAREFVRVGRWFVQPHDGMEALPGKSVYFSFSFAFFVHGESTVCASIDVRTHPLVRNLSRQHLQHAQTSSTGVPVLLAPFGLSGILTGGGKAMAAGTDPRGQRALDEWRQFFPLRCVSDDGVPALVEVAVGGVRMRYPASYVLVTDMDGFELHPPVTQQHRDKCASPPMPVAPRDPPPPPSPLATGFHAGSLQLPLPTAARLPDHVWHDAVLNPAGQSETAAAAPGEADVPPPGGHWDFVDPARKAACACAKCKRPASATAAGQTGSGVSSKGPRLAEKGRTPVRATPFHRRSPSAARSSPPPATRLAGSVTPSGGPPSYLRGQSMTPTPAAGSGGQNVGSVAGVASVGSPASAAPSPLPALHSAPASVPPADAAMPTLSPHPPASAPQPATPAEAALATPAATPTDGGGPKSVSSVSNQVFSPYPAALSVEPSCKTGTEAASNSLPAPLPAGMPAEPAPAAPPAPAALKRPVLASREYETVRDEEQHSALLYDYSTLDAWLNHPVKRFKPSPECPPPAADPAKPPLLRRPSSGDLPAVPTDELPAAAAPAATMPTFIKTEIKQEPGTVPMEIDGTLVRVRKPNRPGGDPYEFDDDTIAPAVSMEGFKRTNSVKEEDKKGEPSTEEEDAAAAAAKTPGNLFTNEGLQASYRDLEQIFDNSDDASSDLEATAMPTPPGSKAGGGDEGAAPTLTAKPPRGSTIGPGNSSLNSCGGSGILRPEELSKMFPTPPSLDNNPVSSPCGGHVADAMYAEMAESVRFKQEIYPNMGSPQEEPIEDWSFVYRPPEQCQYVGSSKYAPLTNLPSAAMPAVSLPPACIYKPSWQCPPPPPAPPAAPRSVSGGHRGAGLSPVSPANLFPPQSPMGWPRGGARTPLPPPPPYELPSPATSTASSYMNKNVNSVEPAAAALGRAPEASALVVNLLLGDTSMNIFRDHNFDSCTLCVCNAGPKVVGNIRGADAGYYLPVPALPPAPHFPPSASPFGGMGGGPPPPYALLEGGTPPGEDDPIRCSCGFSAVVNRRLSHRAGLFYEDEMEITGIAEDPALRRKASLLAYLAPTRPVPADGDPVDAAPAPVLELLREQCAMVGVQTSSNSLCRATRSFASAHDPPATALGTALNVLEFSDSNDVAAHALDQGRLAVLEASTVSMCKVEEMAARQQHALPRNCGGSGSTACVHRWAHVRARGPHCSQDIVRVMKTLQPMLQDAIQKKCQTRLWEAPYTVSGPLTWRQFHRLAGRGTEDRCEPQPVPSLVVGYDKDWLSLSPYAVHYWEKLLLEPYSYARDVAYVVVAPDNDYVLQRVRTYFKELSSTYEVCRLGRHCPITKVLRDGILRVGKSSAVKLAKEPIDEWFLLLGENPTTNMLKLYAQVCRHHLAPYLSQIPMDRTLLDPSDGTSRSIDRPLPSPMPPPSTPETPAAAPEKPAAAAATAPKPAEHTEGLGRDPLLTGGPLSGGDAGHEEDPTEPPALVVYLVDPFTLGSDSTDLQRLACLGLLRCFAAVQAALPDNIRANISVQLISLESIVDLGNTRDRARHADHMRAQAFSVYSQCRKMLSHASNVKALTGFGTAAMSDLFLKNKDEKNRAAYRLYSPPFILGPPKERTESGEMFGQQGIEQCSVLYASYCLSDDQRWLLAVATDELGQILETTTINIEIPNRARRKKASARRVGLHKLMDFILGVMSQSVQPWRLVVGRVGRIGHGELKGWSWLLSRKSLLKASKQLKEICGQCSLLYPNDVPCVLSACLVSLEPDSALRLMPDQLTPDERFSAASVSCQLSTPHDVSCTHILVFPTSATTQSSQTAFQEQHINGPELGDDELFSALNDDMPEGIEGMQDFSDIFTCWPEAGAGGPQSPTGSPRRGDSPSAAGSPGGMGADGGHSSPFPCNATGRNGAALAADAQEEVGTLHQQPLALGYFVSTAPTGRMPSWFWAPCPHLENVCPSFLKNALHLHSPAIQQNSDDLLQQQSNVTVHPLDSQYTTDVLRYVLEGYNALSWLAQDSNTKDRLSCLPVHVQALMQLYHMTAALV